MTDAGSPSTEASGELEGAGPGVVRTNTWAMWLIALLPLAGLLTGVVGFGPPAAVRGSEASGLTVSVSFVPLVIELLLAAADRRILADRGVLAPLHWGWAVIDPIYVIARSVVVRRRVNGSLAPLWLWLLTSVLVITIDQLRR